MVFRAATRLVASAFAMTALGILPSGPPAFAASGDPGTVSGTEQRSCPDTRCSSLTYIPDRTSVSVSCFRDAGSQYGTNRWFRVTYAGQRGWVNANKMPQSQQPVVPYCSDLLPGETLFAGQSIWSGNGRYVLTMQTDGNLVEYGPAGALWASRTRGGARVVQQSDGNLVVYTASYQAPWSTGTMVPGTALVVQSDSNVVLYGAGMALWASSWHRVAGNRAGYNLALADPSQ